MREGELLVREGKERRACLQLFIGTSGQEKGDGLYPPGDGRQGTRMDSHAQRDSSRDS